MKSLFTNEGKHGGEATVEAVQLIAEYVKAHDCQLHPDSIEVLDFPFGCWYFNVLASVSVCNLNNWLGLHDLNLTWRNKNLKC